MIVFSSLCKAFGEKVVLDDFSLEVPDGQATVIIGASGSGKSVALKHVVGLIKPDSGSVTVDGQVVHELDRNGLTELRGAIGYVFQFAALFDSMTVEDNIRLGLKRRDLSESEIAGRVQEALELVDLPDVAGQYPATLSGGMRKRVGIARAIALHPRYILFDEPTTGLDPVTTSVISEVMVRVRRQLQATSVIVTHDMNSAYTVGDRIAMLYQGSVRQVGTVEEMRNTSDPVVRQFIEGRTEPATAP